MTAPWAAGETDALVLPAKTGSFWCGSLVLPLLAGEGREVEATSQTSKTSNRPAALVSSDDRLGDQPQPCPVLGGVAYEQSFLPR